MRIPIDGGHFFAGQGALRANAGHPHHIDRPCALLEERGIEPEVIEYLQNPPTAKELAAILKKLGKTPLEITRTGEKLFNELGLSKTDQRSDAEWLDILAKHPKLIERPIVISGGKAAMGRPPEAVLDIL